MLLYDLRTIYIEITVRTPMTIRTKKIIAMTAFEI